MEGGERIYVNTNDSQTENNEYSYNYEGGSIQDLGSEESERSSRNGLRSRKRSKSI